jgi:Uma2 family endonuclease
MEAPDNHNPIHRISVEAFHRLIAAGIFDSGDRVELIDGEMRDMPPIGPDHGSSTDRLNEIFTPALAGKAIVRVQGAVVLDDATELYPDLCVLRLREDRYRTTNPAGDDVLLLIEVAASSLRLDRTVKLAKYARAGVRRYWIVDLVNRALHDYRDPDRFQRRYRELESLSSGELAVAIEGTELRVDVAELLGVEAPRPPAN